MSTITIKVAHKDDIRRFSVPESISFADFMVNIGKLFKLEEVTIKYTDDEGDAIVVTTDDELREAFRLATELKPPILRVTVHGGSQPQREVLLPPVVAKTVIVEQTITPPASPVLESSSQYPPLDVAFWDAPAKQSTSANGLPPAPASAGSGPAQVKTTTTIVMAAPSAEEQGPEEARFVRISQLTSDHCTSTSQSVSRCSRDTADETLKYSDSTKLQLNDSGLVHSTVSLCSDLSRKIAEDCRMLSLQTSEISRRLADERSAETRGTAKGDLNEMAASVVSFTSRLSEETAQACRSL